MTVEDVLRDLIPRLLRTPFRRVRVDLPVVAPKARATARFTVAIERPDIAGYDQDGCRHVLGQVEWYEKSGLSEEGAT